MSEQNNQITPVRRPSSEGIKIALSYAISAAREKVAEVRSAPRWQQALAGGLLLILVSSSSLLWFALRDSFPMLPAGSYAGVVDNVFGEKDQTRIYVERTPDSNALFTIVLREGWAPQLVTAQVASGDGTVSSLPLSVVAQGHQLKLVGSEIGADAFAGTAEDLVTGRKGTWVLRTLYDQLPAVDSSEMLRFMGLELELESADREFQMARTEREKLEGEYRKLSEFVTDSRALKSRSEQKFMHETELLEQSKRRLKAAQEQSKLIESKFALAERLTPMGRLVLQARESLERDARWLDVALKKQASEKVGAQP